MRKRNIIGGVFTFVMLLAYVGSADVIAYNFSEVWEFKDVQGDGTVFGTDQWTDSTDGTAPGATVTPNSTDPFAITTPINAPGVTVEWTSSNTWQAGDETANLEDQVFRLFLDDGGAGPTITVSGLAAWLAGTGDTGYQLTFYQNTDGANNTFAEWNIYEGVGTGGTILETIAPKFTDGSGTGGGSRLINNAAGTFTADVVTFHTDRDLGGGGRAGVSAFTITSIPEPSTFGLLAVIGGGLMLLRRRRLR